MKTATLFSLSRSIAGLAAGAALLCAAGASAQSPSAYLFQVANMTQSNGDATFPVYDSVTFTNLKISEVFSDNFMTSFTLPKTQTLDTTQSSSFASTAPGGSVPVDPTHGLLTSAILTGSLVFPGIPSTSTLDLTLQPTTDPNSQYDQLVSKKFSADLFGPSPSGIGVGTFSLLDSSGTVQSVNIDAVPAAVPEASTTISLGLLLALGLGSLAVTRRKYGVSAAI